MIPRLRAEEAGAMMALHGIKRLGKEVMQEET